MSPQSIYPQSSVIPYRVSEGRVEILVVSNRGGDRWVLPKGLIDEGLSASESAAKEAMEEAGIVGTVDPDPIGNYDYHKWGGTCRVEVFLMRVEEERTEWLESSRTRRWMNMDEIHNMLDDRVPRSLLSALSFETTGDREPDRENTLMTAKPRLKRTESFFGLHFDIHPGPEHKALGADITEEMIADLLDRVKPDFVQYDCKGHVGYAGYATEVGWPAPHIVKDSLGPWRKVTAEKGVALFIHYSGVLDGVAIEHHPEWAALDPEGNPYPTGQVTSTFGPYVDKLLIPQLVEVIRKYQLDGVWADGESWGAELDYAPAAMKAWKDATGLETAPASTDEPKWEEWKEFHRDRFEEYVGHWVDSVHAECPDAELCSNWMYSISAPRPVATNVDFLSGDYSPSDSADTGRRQARYLASTGMPWDLMSWGFILTHPPEEERMWKLPVQLMQEAGTVLMQGGGFQVYYQPTDSGAVTEHITSTMEPVAAFCRARQEVSHKSTTVPQVALLFSETTLWDRCQTPFDPEPAKLFDELHGMLHALLELHYSVDVLAEHQLVDRLDEFPLVVIPHATRLGDGFRKRLLEYVERGGRLLVSGADAAGLFRESLGVTFDSGPEEVSAVLHTEDAMGHVNGSWQNVTPVGAEVLASRHATYDLRSDEAPAATVAACGKGQIAALYGPVSLACFQSHHPALRNLVAQAVQRLFPDPSVTVDAPIDVDIALRRTADGRTSLHLLNLSAAQRGPNFLAVERIPEIGPITARIRMAEKPQKVSWVPDGTELDWSWNEGTLEVTVPSLHIHGVIVIE
ncbi:MAG: beta-galactosidase trimerization domain-containing protein [Lentisphaerae bacterium]|nr:beta-galactosidase trimerization domain-containing protein [Lentisphaerota bacterium]